MSAAKHICWHSPISSIIPVLGDRGQRNAGANPATDPVPPGIHCSVLQTSLKYPQSVQGVLSNQDRARELRPRYVRDRATDRPTFPAYWSGRQCCATDDHAPGPIESLAGQASSQQKL